MQSILWRNIENTIILIDIPGSIAAAQGTKEEPYTHLLRSSEPLQEPFEIHATSEGRAASWLKTGLKRDENADVLHESYCGVLEEALEVVKSHHKGQWCLPRPFVSRKHRGPHVLKRYHRVVEAVDGDDLPPDLFNRAICPSLVPTECRMESEGNFPAWDSYHEHGSYLWTHTIRPATLTLTTHDLSTAKSTNFQFCLPARSAAFLGDCSEPQPFHDMLLEADISHLQKDNRDVASSFRDDSTSGEWLRRRQKRCDFILLDPPWPNRSVKRTHKSPGTSYSTTKLDDLETMLSGLGLCSLLSDTGYVGVWITNKLAVRKFVLDLFDKWGLQLVENWIWLKVTAHGEPSSPLKDTWNGKRPYEVLLIATAGHADVRAHSAATNANTSTVDEDSTSRGHFSAVKRKVIIGVPDLHSRKPCLKELVEDLVGNPNARVLEIFARYLVSGWCSWGNECLKYNWEGYWQNAEASSKTSSEHTLSMSTT